MLLQRVSLQGFLAHHGTEKGGRIAPIELDFQASNLWLMHGPNGSGKSTVFDAITYALFGEARGSQLYQLINDRSDSAHVELEFAANGELYRIRRSLKMNKTRDGHQNAGGEVARWNAEKNDWEIVPGVGNKIKEWSAKTLQVSYENFVSAVILKQGETGRFLDAKPVERKKRLMELLDLKVYEELGKAANARRTAANKILADRQKILENCSFVSPEEVEAAQNAVADAQNRLEAAQKATVAAQKVWEDAQTAANLRAEIAAKISLQEQDAPLLTQKEAIETAAQERDDLNAILPTLANLKTAREALEAAQNELDSARRNLEAAQHAETGQRPLVEAAEKVQIEAAQAWEDAQNALKTAENAAARAAGDAQSLNQIESLERQIAESKAALNEHREILACGAEIEARRDQIREIREVGHKVKPIQDAQKKLVEAQNTLQKLENTRRETKNEAKRLENLAALAIEAREKSEIEATKLESDKTRIEADLSCQSDILERRELLGETAECPTCGTHLDDATACERLAEERENLRRAVAKLQKRAGELASQVTELQASRRDKTGAEKSALEAWRVAQSLETAAQTQIQSARETLEEWEIELQNRREDAGEWADDDFESLRARSRALGDDTIKNDLAALAEARNLEIESGATTRTCRNQLETLPVWNARQRAEIRRLEGENAAALTSAQNAEFEAKTRANSANFAFKTAQEALALAQNTAKVAAGLETQRAAASQAAREQLERQFAALPPLWTAHAAARENAALLSLVERRDEVENVAAQLGALRAAQQRVAQIGGAIQILEGQLAKIPAAHQIAPQEAEHLAWESQNAVKTQIGLLDEATGYLSSLERDRNEFLHCETERNEAGIEATRYDDLAKAFGRDGLQARVIREAQENLKRLANGILGRLSRGQWQIDLRGESDDELEIIARDEGRGGFERTFDCLSGGERFRVAVSLAIAIGQMALGGAPMNTLVIDEGFGALDEENRGLMVDNLRHLSEHELKNGRIIVVSHQDDVCHAFGHRYRLGRDDKGYASVELVRE